MLFCGDEDGALRFKARAESCGKRGADVRDLAESRLGTETDRRAQCKVVVWKKGDFNVRSKFVERAQGE